MAGKRKMVAVSMGPLQTVNHILRRMGRKGPLATVCGGSDKGVFGRVRICRKNVYDINPTCLLCSVLKGVIIRNYEKEQANEFTTQAEDSSLSQRREDEHDDKGE